MTDVFSKSKRSRIMSAIGRTDTRPEKTVRRLLHSMGYRFRLHVADLPGTPDIVLPKYRAVVFVHGCFWHGHGGCSRAKLPQTNRSFWQEKVAKNKARDRNVKSALTRSGWRYFVVWQCDLRNQHQLRVPMQQFLSRGNS